MNDQEAERVQRANENQMREDMMRSNAEREVHWGGSQGRTDDEMEMEVHHVMNRMRMAQ